MARRSSKIVIRDRPSYDETIRQINKALPYAASTLIEAMKATKKVPVIEGRDDKGRPTYKYIEVPDHYIRIMAAKAILNKRIPDVNKTEHTGQVEFKPVIFSQDVKDAISVKPGKDKVKQLPSPVH